MSLNINIDRVTHVLLPDGWHEVQDQSFDLDAYEFVESTTEYHGAQQHRSINGTSGFPTGFVLTERGDRVAGPITSIIAVRYG